MADGQGNNKQKVPKFEVKFVGGPRYDLSNLPKTKSGNRRRSFRRRKIPQQLEGIGLLFNRVSLFDTIKKRWVVIAIRLGFVFIFIKPE